ncbi:MAG: CvpA family protein [Bacteroidales bacterium]
MNYIDIILIIPIIWFAYQGFRHGLIIELASLVALILGIYAAMYFSHYAGNFLTNSLGIETEYLPVISFILTFVVVVILVYVVGKILEKLINMVALGFLNKMAGAVFGMLKATVLLSIIILILNHFNDNLISKEKQEGSYLYAPVAGIAPLLWKNLENLNIDNNSPNKVIDDQDSFTI